MREALTANRDLRAARSAIDIVRGGLLQAGRLKNPELEVGYADDFEVQSAFYSVRAQEEQLGVNRQLIASVRDVEEATARRVEAAEASPAEVSLLRIERLRLEQDAQRLVRERDIAAAALTRLLGRSALDGLTPIGELDPGPVPSPVSLLTGASVSSGRPDLEGASQGVERADADRALARSEIWEDWTVGLGYEHARGVFDDPIGVKRDSLLTFGVTVPLPLWNRQQGRIAAAEAELRRSRHSRDALILRIEEEVRAAQARVRTLRVSADAYADEILPEATRAQELFERGYRQGLVGVAELLQAQRQYNESRALYFELLGDLRQATIELEAATGTNPYLNGGRGPRGRPRNRIRGRCDCRTDRGLGSRATQPRSRRRRSRSARCRDDASGDRRDSSGPRALRDGVESHLRPRRGRLRPGGRER